MRGYKVTANWKDAEIRATKGNHGWVIRPKPEKRYLFDMALIILEDLGTRVL